MIVEFTVYGRPQPQGSTRAFIPKGWSRAVITSANPKIKSFRQEVMKSALASEQVKEFLASSGGELPLFPKPLGVAVRFDFFFAKPKSDRSARQFKATRPDICKLLRCMHDALTKTVYEDDSQVCTCIVTKQFGLPERVEAKIMLAKEEITNGKGVQERRFQSRP